MRRVSHAGAILCAILFSELVHGESTHLRREHSDRSERASGLDPMMHPWIKACEPRSLSLLYIGLLYKNLNLLRVIRSPLKNPRNDLYVVIRGDVEAWLKCFFPA